ncbi:MAG TPA: alpha/beta fold hydrolase [Anaerolineales bacterium]
MNALLWLLLPVGFALVVGLAASFYVTSRQPRSAFHSPAEYGLEFEEVPFKAKDGLQLQGCWIPATGSKRAVIILHGHGGSLDWDIHRAPALHAAGFNVFLFDFRAHGRSQGHQATFGYLERRDVLGAVELLQRRGVKSIGLMGFSYGALASMLTAPVCPDVRAVVADGGPTRLRTALAARAVEFHVPRGLAIPLAWLTVAITSARLGVNLFHYEPVRWVGKIAPRPIFFIHGELDQYCPDFDELFAAAGESKEAWRLRGVGHTKASETHPEEFRRRVIEFFDRNL